MFFSDKLSFSQEKLSLSEKLCLSIDKLCLSEKLCLSGEKQVYLRKTEFIDFLHKWLAIVGDLYWKFNRKPSTSSFLQRTVGLVYILIMSHSVSHDLTINN